VGSRSPRNILSAGLAMTFVASVFCAGQTKRPIPKLEPSAAVIARGKAVYSERCEICHFSASDAKKIGPGLKGIYTRGKYADGTKVNDASMEAWIEKGGKDMPPFGGAIKTEQLHDLISYLRTL